MSKKFIEFRFPCGECLVQAACKEKAIGKIDELLRHNDLPCLTIPRYNPNEIAYHKVLLECWANMGRDVIGHMSKMEEPETKTEKVNNIPMQYFTVISRIVGVLTYMVNSKSWVEGQLYSFDYYEIKSKLSRIILDKPSKLKGLKKWGKSLIKQ